GAGVGCAGARRVGIAARIPRATRVHRPTTGHATAECLHALHVTLVAHTLAVAARRGAGIVVGVRAGRAVAREHVRLHAHPELGIRRADLAAGDRAHVAIRVRAHRAGLRRAPAAGRVAAPVALIGARARLAHVILVARARAVAARRRARVAVAVRARHAVVLEHVVLHTHPELGIGRAQLAARDRADVAVRVRARRARLRRTLPAGRVAAPVALIGARARLGHVILV